ncbi:hypothetical protein TSUD_364990 [Trifolium subterraneum]|uniref:MOM1 alpha-helical domain-containing protein n=1 Tax=Trifolium subterraneum TaxID=3900 RepID=A0A2Z6MUA6_TRISU|nr:hypothetical protein TSUD_364990 [Trifolium subterraneum]
MDGGKVDECLKGNSLDCNAVSKDCILPSEDANVRAEYSSTNHDETSKKCVENDKGENYTPKRKSTTMDKCSDITATLVDDDYCNLIERPPCHNVETSRSSKRIRLSSNVDQPTSKSTDEKPCAINMEDSGRPQQKSLYLSLKSDIEKLCEILRLPDNVKTVVGKILEYIMNNHLICAEPPATMLHAFQLSVCSNAASLLKHKFDIEASLVLAKKHLNFDCKKYDVHQNLTMKLLWEKFLLVKEKSNVTGSPEAFESSNRVHSNSLIIPYVESTETYVSRIINESRNRKNQWRKLLEMQLENKNNLKKDFETKEVDLAKRYKIELGAYQKYYVMTKEKLEDYKAEYYKRLAELKRQHDVRLQAFETKKLEARQKFRESWTLDEVLETTGELSREEAVRLSNTVKSTTDYLQEKAITLNSSSTNQKSEAGLDRVVSSRPCISISSSDEESECQIIDNVVVNKSTTLDHQEVVRKTMTENTTLSRMTSVSRPVNLIEPQEQVHLKPLLYVESRPSPVIILPSNQSNHVSIVTEPIEKMQQKLPSSRFSSQDALSRRSRLNCEKEMKKIQAKFQEEQQKSRMLHLQDAGFNPMLHQPLIQQNAICTSLDTSSTSRGRATATSQKSFTSAGSHTMALSPPLHTSYGPSTFLPASYVNGILHCMPSHTATRNLQAGVEIRTPAPHLYVSSTIIPSSSVSGVPQGTPSHSAVPYGLPSCPAAPSNSPASSFSHHHYLSGLPDQCRCQLSLRLVHIGGMDNRT